jgi:NADH:ubiquinone oxidoreductase subunit 2 (subunit N)
MIVTGAALVFFLPILAGGAAYLFRRWQTVEVLIAALACGLIVLLLAQPALAASFGVDIGGRLDFLGRGLQINPPDRLALALLFGCGLALTVASWRTPENWTYVPLGLVMLGVCSATMIIRPLQYAGLGFVIAGALGALMIQAERNGEGTTLGATRFLVINVLALPLFLGAGYFLQRATLATDADAAAQTFGPAIQFLIIGIGLVIGAVPVFSWIHPVSKDAPPLTTAFLATIMQGSVGFLLLTFLRDYPWFRDASEVRTALQSGGVVLLIMAALLGWAQRSFSRVLACALLAMLGSTLIAIHADAQRGIETAALMTIARALSAGLFGIGVALLRQRAGNDGFDNIAGLGQREPWIALALGLGGLSMTGLPGTVGYVALSTGLGALGTETELVLAVMLANISVAIGLLSGLVALFRGAAAPTAALVVQQRNEQVTIAIGMLLVIGLGLFPNVIAPLAQSIAGLYVGP